LLAVVLALVATGCGSKPKPVTKAQYEQRLAAIGHDLYLAANALGSTTNTQIFNNNVDKLKQVVHDAAKELNAVRPPGLAAQRQNARLVDAYRQLEKQFDGVKDARRISYPRAVAALQAVQKSAGAHETVAAAQQLRKLGYKVPVFATIGGSA
jgi:acetyl esterase/lipase